MAGYGRTASSARKVQTSLFILHYLRGRSESAGDHQMRLTEQEKGLTHRRRPLWAWTSEHWISSGLRIHKRGHPAGRENRGKSITRVFAGILHNREMCRSSPNSAGDALRIIGRRRNQTEGSTASRRQKYIKASKGSSTIATSEGKSCHLSTSRDAPQRYAW